MFLGEFEQMVLLAILQKDEKAYGVEVRRELEACPRRRVTRGAFYTTLDRLESNDYLSWPPRPVAGWRGPVGRAHGRKRRGGIHARQYSARYARRRLGRGLA